jgi:L-alanine-DL-glutamate epimerase-like enolase superfamily enzyme
MASVHAAAATESFLALENHSADVPEWSHLIEGLPTPLVQDGRIAVPETPGLGFTGLDREACSPFLDPRDPGWFEPTDAWDSERAHDRLWS